MPEDLGALRLPATVRGDGEKDPVAAVRKAIEWAWESDHTDLWPLLRDMLERELLQYALTACEGNQTHVAQRLGVVRNTVRKRIQQFGLE
jgi:Fis family transcriptional regulator